MSNIASTLGFIFTSDFKKVLLIRKQKPDHHKGLLNGLGGKLEKEESLFECIVREVKEESGLMTTQSEWVEVGHLQWTKWDVSIFATTYAAELSNTFSPDADEVNWYDTEQLPTDMLTNLYWLIPMCIDALKNKSNFKVHIQYL